MPTIVPLHWQVLMQLHPFSDAALQLIAMGFWLTSSNGNTDACNSFKQQCFLFERAERGIPQYEQKRKYICLVILKLSIMFNHQEKKFCVKSTNLKEERPLAQYLISAISLSSVRMIIRMIRMVFYPVMVFCVNQYL